ncbi:MAG: TRAP transporter small permease subunit [Rhodothermaceae bacterium]|nr:TRAP transporter small permease subunit [Rhodothermaceae bacterium]
MRLLLRLSHAIDRLTGRIGRATGWLLLAMIVVGALGALLRYLGRPLGLALALNAFGEAQWYLFSAVFLLGAAWTLRDDAHVRVDVLYGRLSPKRQALIDLAGTLLFLLPFCALMLWATLPAVAESWAVREGSPDPGGLPRYPIKALVPVAFVLLGLQGLSQAIKATATLRGEAATPASGPHHAEGV